ncbi:MAG: hypothetical protein ACR2MA_06135 [Egibacteraceae bacterium]
MQIPKDQIMQLLRDQNEPGDASKADQAEQELPQQVDTENQEHQSLLEKFGLNPQDLMSKFSGGLGL